jgi:U4/U6.U5 tri-snRNP-associated protein 1
VPQAAEFLDPQPLSKGKTERVKNKKKDAAKAQALKGESGFMTLPAPPSSSAAADNGAIVAGSPAVSSPNSGSPGPSMRPGFSRISSTVDSPSVSHVGTPGPDERTKVVFGLGTKRKAEEEEEGSLRSKRR